MAGSFPDIVNVAVILYIHTYSGDVHSCGLSYDNYDGLVMCMHIVICCTMGANIKCFGKGFPNLEYSRKYP